MLSKKLCKFCCAFAIIAMTICSIVGNTADTVWFGVIAIIFAIIAYKR